MPRSKSATLFELDCILHRAAKLTDRNQGSAKLIPGTCLLFRDVSCPSRHPTGWGRGRLFSPRHALVMVSVSPTSLVGRTHMFRLDLARIIHQRSNVGICTCYRLPLLAFECE